MTSIENDHSLAECERIDREWTDRFAAKRKWDEFDLEDPIEDLKLFFSNLSNMNCSKIRILDAGCGWGRYVFRFQGLEYVGLDHSEEMLKVARRDNFQPWQTFTQGTTSSMPFPEHSFDGIWSCCALAGFPAEHLVDVLEEHRRVLRPGGIMVIIMADSLWDEGGLYSTELGDMYQSRYTLETFLGYVAKTGFEIINHLSRSHEGSYTVIVRNPA